VRSTRASSRQEGQVIGHVFEYLDAQDVVEAAVAERDRVAVVIDDVGLAAHAERVGLLHVQPDVFGIHEQASPGRLAGPDVEDASAARAELGSQETEDGQQLQVEKTSHGKERRIVPRRPDGDGLERFWHRPSCVGFPGRGAQGKNA
jgi:hypothetical protein